MRDRADQFIHSRLPAGHTVRVSFLFESGLLNLADNSLDDAKSQLQQALAQFRRTKRRFMDQVVSLAGLAQCELKSGKPGAAADLAAEATALARKFAVPGQPSYWLGVALLAQVDVQQSLGDAERVRELSAEALSQLTPTVGVDHPLTKRAAALAVDRSGSSAPASSR
jgi:ATP/maltotriose-dependent transcriptional regulator MalT